MVVPSYAATQIRIGFKIRLLPFELRYNIKTVYIARVKLRLHSICSYVYFPRQLRLRSKICLRSKRYGYVPSTQLRFTFQDTFRFQVTLQYQQVRFQSESIGSRFKVCSITYVSKNDLKKVYGHFWIPQDSLPPRLKNLLLWILTGPTFIC